MRILSPFFFDVLSQPWVLIFLLLVPILWGAEVLARAPGAMSFSTGEVLHRLRGGHSGLLRLVPPFMRALGLSALIVALAGPLDGFQVRRDRASVLDIMLCVDLSGSMQARDFYADGQFRDRLYAVKIAVRDFIDDRKTRSTDRYGLDRLGLIFYAGYAWTAVPLTLDYGILEHEMANASIEMVDPRKQGTAIGSAIGLAVRRLSQSEAETKVIVLMTDGINNRGELDPVTAAELAREYDIRIYTVGAGSVDDGSTRRGPFAQRHDPIDEETLTKIADITGGAYFRASDLPSLQRAYTEINAMERTEIELGDHYEYKDAFAPYALLGGLLLLGSVLCRRTWFEPIP